MDFFWTCIIQFIFFSFGGGNENQTRRRGESPRFSFSGGVFRQLMPTRNISILLDNLLSGYDRKLRPRFGGPPTVVEIDVEVRSMGEISELDMTFSMDCYFRQSWVDERLAFAETEEEAFTLSLSVLERLWKPDTFIYNGKHSYTHLITTPNRFIRLHNSGKILYSSRLTIKATCPMSLENFPMDTQRCPLKLGSFGYTTNDVVYRWNAKRQLAIAADMKLSQFDLIATPSGFEILTRQTGNFSVLISFLHLRRHMGYFVIQVYAPCMLINVLSWVAFWINREATSDRVALGVTTVLTMTFLGLEARKDLPKVTYSTALDQFVWISFAFIFATVIEFAFVHSFTKFGSGEVMLSDLYNEWGEQWDDEVEEEEELEEYYEDDSEEGEEAEEGDLDEIERAERGRANCRGVLILNSNQYQYQMENCDTCFYCGHPWSQHASQCKVTRKEREPGSKEASILHSSLPRHIERNMSLSFPPASLPRRSSGSKNKRSNRVMAYPIKEDALFSGGAQERRVGGSEMVAAEEILRLNRVHLERELCSACKKRLRADTKRRRRREIVQRRKHKIKTLKNLIFHPWCGGRWSISNARRRVKEARIEESRRKIPKDEQTNSVSYIDQASRVLFPLSFLLINLLYWYSYLSLSQRLLFQ